MNQPQAGVGKDTVSCVPFPSMRHAHHLATINPPGLGGRFPPTAPENRDESALHRVSNYSIRPCIHDAQLAQRFGAKAARGMSYTGEGSGQIRPAGGGCGAASVTSSYSHSEPGHATSADVDVDSPAFAVVPRSVRYEPIQQAKAQMGEEYVEQALWGPAGTAVFYHTAT